MFNHFYKKLVLTCLIAFSSLSAVNATIILDFEDIDTTSSGYISLDGNYVSQGFLFSSANSNGIYVASNSHNNLPNSGSNMLNTRYRASFTLASVSGGLFDLNSLLALEGRNTNTGFWNYSAQTINVVGTRDGLSDLVMDISLDLFAQNNDLLDSELVNFNNWTGLSSVVFSGLGGAQNGYSFGLDDINLSLTEVPEPSTILLILAALFGIRLRAQR